MLSLILSIINTILININTIINILINYFKCGTAVTLYSESQAILTLSLIISERVIQLIPLLNPPPPHHK